MTVRAGDSSMKTRAWLRASPASFSFSNSRSLMKPVRARLMSSWASAHRSRMTICSLAISIEKKPTEESVRVPTCWVMFRARAVLPIEGLAARMTSSDGWKPAVSELSEFSPVGIPVMASLRSWSRWIRSSVGPVRTDSGWKPSLMRCSATSTIAVWAAFSSSSASSF